MFKLLVAAFLLGPLAAFGQSCGTGSVINSSVVNIGSGCTPVSAQVGNYISLTGQTASMATTTLCSAAQCPAGTYLIHGYVRLTSAATLGAMIGTLNYTDDSQARQMPLFTSLSLVSNSSTTGFSEYDKTIVSNGTQPITMNTTITGLTGTTSYNIDASVYKLH